ncbi:MAG: hypothetical protein R6W92_17625 [Desulfocurvibacter africanus]
MPAQEDDNEDAQFNDQIGGGEHEGNRGDEMRTFYDPRPSRSQCRKGARKADSPKSGGQTDAFGIRNTQARREPALGHKRLYHDADKVSQNESSAGFSKKPADVLTASPNETQNLFENKMLIPRFFLRSSSLAVNSKLFFF